MLQMPGYHVNNLSKIFSEDENLIFTKYLRYFLRNEKYDSLNDGQYLALNIFQHLQSNAEWLMLLYVYCNEEF